LTGTKEGTFKINDEGKDIKQVAVDEVTFNFMRKHQVVEESADIPLSELIRQNQERAARNMRLSQEKLRRRESQKSVKRNTFSSSSALFTAYPGVSGNLSPQNYRSHNILNAQATGGLNCTSASRVMAKTFASHMNSHKQSQVS